MNCRVVRDRLDGSVERNPEIEKHLRECPRCQRYAERLDVARRLLRAHRGDFEPDKGFAGRVAARLPNEPIDLLGQAALRLLPASLVLVFVLVWFAVQVTPDFSSESTANAGDDLLIWVLAPPSDPS